METALLGRSAVEKQTQKKILGLLLALAEPKRSDADKG